MSLKISEIRVIRGSKRTSLSFHGLHLRRSAHCNVALASLAQNNALVPRAVSETPSPRNVAFIEEEDTQPVASSSKNVD